MAVSGSEYGIKRTGENSDFPSDCSKPKYKRRKISAKRDFPIGLVQFGAEPEEMEAMESVNPLVFCQASSANSNHVLNQKKSEEELEAVESNDESPVVYYQVARRPRKVYARRDYPEAVYANCSHFLKPNREDSESEPEELEAIGSDDGLASMNKEESVSDPEELEANPNHVAEVERTERNCELEEIVGKPMGIEPICSVEKMGSEIPKGIQNQEPVNQIVGSTEPLDSSRTRGDYLQHLIASLDQLAATLMQMKQQGAFKKRSAV